MARPNKQKQLLKKAREEKNSKKTFKITNVKRYVLALFYTGICYTNSSLLFLLNDIEAPGKTEFYEAQGEISNFLYQFANYSVNMAFENMKPNTIVSIDGSWSCRRNAKYFILDAIDTTTHKVIAYVLLHKATKGLPGNYQGPSNMMEATAFKMLLPLLQSCDKIVGLVRYSKK